MIGMMVFSNSIYSQQDSTKGKVEFIIKADLLLPACFFFGDLSDPSGSTIESLTFETCFLNRNSIQFTAINRYDHSLFNNKWEQMHDQLQVNQFILEYKYFLKNQKSYTGFYTGIFLEGVTYTNSQEFDTYGSAPHEYSFKINNFGGGIFAGHQSYLFKHFVIDYLLGFGDTHLLRKDEGFRPYSYLDMRMAFNIGYKF
jgi:hypothetical protein